MADFAYRTGEAIEDGDRVLYHGEPGEVLFVARAASGDPEQEWFLDEYGGGVMLLAQGFGRVFIESPHGDDLEFVSRKQAVK